MKINILNIEGKKLREINLPKCFSADIREDVVVKVLEAKKRQQPYAPSLVGGKQHSASGIIKHKTCLENTLWPWYFENSKKNCF